ncbi:thioredoxin family protein [Clostridium formicaceticum]|uniref:Thiol reductase thioredoxin n=1 Tax=Clostridium formicaceticum TaxID=1497 RepID=A0AAC9RM23_9CLOT|nr:thioredoxin family protein [Clostridium formicaceticum]AOY77614.1 thiol reductase thioredoxin [Clostridium formicaceticum]ARE88194.1 Thioredoxin-like protein [Clostridium formicaceticum]
MNENYKTTPSKGLAVKILIPTLILMIIGGIWFLKNAGKNSIVSEEDSDFALHVIDDLNLEELKSYRLPIIIDFGADACIPCKEMAPVLEELNEELRGKAIIKFVDVWKYQALVEDYPIRVIPTQVFWGKEGKPYVPSNPQAIQMQMYSMKDTDEHVFTIHEGGMTKEQILAVLKEMGVE